jgi:transposase
MMTRLLQQVAADCQAYVIVLRLDQAAWHTPPKLAVPENMRLLPLPPGRPALTPTEHLWADVRANERANRRLDSWKRVEGA